MNDIIYYSTEPRKNNYIVEKCSGYGIGELIRSMKSPVGCEIGLAGGYTTKHLMECNSELFLYGIDPFQNYVDWNGNNLNTHDLVYDEFLLRTKEYSNRIKVIKKNSDDAVDDIEDNSLDFIFIDGLHTYDQVTKDMTNYYSKVKEGGIFSGHDYTVIPCIYDAVNKFASTKNKTILTTECDVWYWYK